MSKRHRVAGAGHAALALTSVALRAPSVSAKADISILQRLGHFYFALTRKTNKCGFPPTERIIPTAVTRHVFVNRGVARCVNGQGVRC